MLKKICLLCPLYSTSTRNFNILFQSFRRQHPQSHYKQHQPFKRAQSSLPANRQPSFIAPLRRPYNNNHSHGNNNTNNRRLCDLHHIPYSLAALPLWPRSPLTNRRSLKRTCCHRTDIRHENPRENLRTMSSRKDIVFPSTTRYWNSRTSSPETILK